MRANSILSVALIVLFAASETSAEPRRYRYKVAPVKDGGAITGRVVFQGKVPSIRLRVTKDPDVCCKKGAKDRPSARHDVGKKGGVKHAVVFLTEVRSGKAFPKKPPVLDQTGCTFEPHILIVPEKAKLEIRNSDPVLHNVHAYHRSRDLFNLAMPSRSPPMKWALRKEGIVSLQCDAGHSWMSGYIFVVKHPYYAVTDENGAFTLDDVPPGKYTLRVWHERWETLPKARGTKDSDRYIQLDVPVTVGKGAKLDLGFSLSADGKLAPAKKKAK